MKGPIIFLHPNAGDDEITSEILSWMGGKIDRDALERLVRANLFEGSLLSVGKVVSLNGQTRTVICNIPGRRDICEIDGIDIYLRNNPENKSNGAVYSTSKLRSKEGYTFLLPLQ
ncbi:hypothetical protein FNU79_00760 [Deinococcus detaillensis]|uniref:Uncharacterized protein n=1 Tax=Deinococcus detaillensis TaxID=2592048 RepID=A0A553V5S0_9DEIO|nr:hypothetical protein [Deinococcus detaillensis]TSA87818.1 hypothetical protein FNU79_00760 [Deinococcus detaillensis]